MGGLKRYVIMHAEDAHGHPYRLAPLVPFVAGRGFQDPYCMVQPDAVFKLGAMSPGIYWRKGGVFITRKAAEEYAADNLVQNTYRIVEVDRKELKNA